MAYDWTIKSDVLANIEAQYTLARSDYFLVGTQLSNASSDIDAVTDDNAKSALRKLYNAVGTVRLMGARMQTYHAGHDPHFGISYFLEHYTISDVEPPEEYNLTWLKITEAWMAADTFGRQATILAIDFMRRDVWNKPISLTDLAGYDWIS